MVLIPKSVPPRKRKNNKKLQNFFKSNHSNLCYPKSISEIGLNQIPQFYKCDNKKYIFFTDGSCLGNEIKNNTSRKGGYAAIMVHNPNMQENNNNKTSDTNTKIMVYNANMQENNNKTSDTNTKIMVHNPNMQENNNNNQTSDTNTKRIYIYGKLDKKLAPTNIRAEGEAILSVFRYMQGLNDWISCEILLDSEFWHDMIYKYMRKWNDKDFESHANPDLTKQLWNFYKSLTDKNHKIILTPIRAHNKSGGKNFPIGTYEHFCFMTNDAVDKLARYACNCTELEEGKFLSGTF